MKIPKNAEKTELAADNMYMAVNIRPTLTKSVYCLVIFTSGPYIRPPKIGPADMTTTDKDPIDALPIPLSAINDGDLILIVIYATVNTNSKIK